MSFARFLTVLIVLSPSLAHAAACSNPDGSFGQVIYNWEYGVFQGCTPSGWEAFNADACAAGDCPPCGFSPSPGDTCADGTIYAGLSPDGNVPMYMTPADAGQMSWNNGTSNWIDLTGMTNCTNATPGTASSCQTGEANTTYLVGLSDAASPYEAALYCHCLGKPATGTCSSDPTSGADGYGHSDWYLPAQDELSVVYENLVDQDGNNVPGGPLGDPAALFGFNVTGAWPAGYYWSSSEGNNDSARGQRFSDGHQSNGAKSYGVSVRCVRR